MNIKELINEAKDLNINDPKMIASWIYNRKSGKKHYTVRELKALVAANE